MSEFPCPSCGSKKRFHKKGCSVRQAQVKQAVAEVIENRKEKSLPETKEVLRTPQDLPQVGEWYVLNFAMPMGINELGRKIYGLQVDLASVRDVVQHGRDYKVTFDMEKAKTFMGGFQGDLFTPAADVVKALRALADLVERGVGD